MTPEDVALGILRRHADSLTRPNMAEVAEQAGIAKGAVEALWDKLLSGKRDAFRAPGAHRPPAPAPATVLPIAPDHPAPTDRWRNGIDHPEPAIARKAARVVAMIAEVEAALAAEAERDELRVQEAALLASLQKIRKKLHPGLSCPHNCGRVFETPQALGVHRARSHHRAGAAS